MWGRPGAVEGGGDGGVDTHVDIDDGDVRGGAQVGGWVVEVALKLWWWWGCMGCLVRRDLKGVLLTFGQCRDALKRWVGGGE